MRRILTPRELADLLPSPTRPVTELEAASLMRMFSGQESDRVPPPTRSELARVIPLRRRLTDAEIDRLLSEPPPDDDEPPRPWPPPRPPKKAS